VRSPTRALAGSRVVAVVGPPSVAAVTPSRPRAPCSLGSHHDTGAGLHPESPRNEATTTPSTYMKNVPRISTTIPKVRRHILIS
jgi:hypothetical protein